MAGRGTDILLGGNPEFMAKQECLKRGIAQKLKAAAGEITAKPDDPALSYFYYGGDEYQVSTDQSTKSTSAIRPIPTKITTT